MLATGADLGVVPKGVEFLLETIHHKFKANFFEIYNETVIDLLNASTTESKSNAICDGKVTNLHSIDIASADHFNATLKKIIERRKMSATSRNSGSSRSHAVIQLELKGEYANNMKKQVFESNIMFLDLAGSENANDHLDDIESGKRKIEMANINKSLNNFRTVIESLKKKEPATDFRSSKLTHLLKPCLTKNTKTLLLTTISQENKHLSSSKASLALAQLAGQIQIKNVTQNLCEN